MCSLHLQDVKKKTIRVFHVQSTSAQVFFQPHRNNDNDYFTPMIKLNLLARDVFAWPSIWRSCYPLFLPFYLGVLTASSVLNRLLFVLPSLPPSFVPPLFLSILHSLRRIPPFPCPLSPIRQVPSTSKCAKKNRTRPENRTWRIFRWSVYLLPFNCSFVYVLVCESSNLKNSRIPVHFVHLFFLRCSPVLKWTLKMPFIYLLSSSWIWGTVIDLCNHFFRSLDDNLFIYLFICWSIYLFSSLL